MKLDESNLVVQRYKNGYCLAILMPDGSRNYLHTDLEMPINDTLIVRDLLLDQEFSSQEIEVYGDGEYFRIRLELSDINGTKYTFHSRKLNLNDAVFERMQLANA